MDGHWPRLEHDWMKHRIRSVIVITLRAQSFTSLRADLRQKRGFAFSRCLNRTFPFEGSALPIRYDFGVS